MLTCARRALVPSGKPWLWLPWPRPEEGVKTPPVTRYASVFTNVLYCVLKTLNASRFR